MVNQTNDKLMLASNRIYDDVLGYGFFLKVSENGLTLVQELSPESLNVISSLSRVYCGITNILSPVQTSPASNFFSFLSASKDVDFYGNDSFIITPAVFVGNDNALNPLLLRTNVSDWVSQESITEFAEKEVSNKVSEGIQLLNFYFSDKEFVDNPQSRTYQQAQQILRGIMLLHVVMPWASAIRAGDIQVNERTQAVIDHMITLLTSQLVKEVLISVFHNPDDKAVLEAFRLNSLESPLYY